MEQEQKPLSKFTDREWRGTIITLTFIGIFIFFLGVYEGNLSYMKLGGIMAGIGIVGGFVLHYFFGIRIIQLRNDMKHPKYRGH